MPIRREAAQLRALLTGYTGRTAARAFLLLLAVSLLCFFLFQLTPGDFFIEARFTSRLSAATVDALRAEHALDRPFLLKYFYWVASVFHGDWGYSFAYNRPAAALLWPRAANTLLLTITANLAAWLVAVPLAIWSAGARGRYAGIVIGGFISVLLALPDLLIVLLLLFLAARTGIFPVGGMSSVAYSGLGGWSQVSDRIGHLILPAAALALSMLPLIVEHARSSVTEVLASPFIKAAHAHGIPRLRILFRHALPAAANALLSVLGISIGTLLSSSVLVEAAFGWPGLGQLLLQATLERDFYVVIDVVMLSALFLIVGNFLADLLQRAVDPRIRLD